MAEDWFTEPGFDWHPHRGMETVTFVLEGRQRHGDSTGTRSELGPGDAQWMTAGRGIIHQELAAGPEPVHSLQLWVNLAADRKLIEPAFQDLRRADRPVREVPGGRIVAYAGPGTDTVVQRPMALVDVELDGTGPADLDVPAAWRAIAYVLDSEVVVGGRGAVDGQVVVSHPGPAGDVLRVEAERPARVLVFSGLPIGEPVVQRGPFVMSTEAEVAEAFADARVGRLAPLPGR
jgi:redox-sensitive bicupin YhaK (pirin superfamily)